MEKRSSVRFAWIGDSPSPIPDPVDIESSEGINCFAVLVSGDLDPDQVSARIEKYCGPDVPWVVYGIRGETELWLEAGAAGFLPAGTPRDTITATLIGISMLVGKAATRNPLSGLPGNVSIASKLKSSVIEGNALAAYFDISGFKPFNDYYGFSRGDAVLRALASIISDNLSEYFVGHIGGDDFIAIGEGPLFIESVNRAVRVFNGRAGGFYSGKDHAAGGIEALDRKGEFRFYPIMDLTVSIVNGRGCGTVEQLALRAGLEKKRIKGELLPDTVASFLSGGTGKPDYEHFLKWKRASNADILQVKALIESAGILGDTRMIQCLIEILGREKDHRIRKSAARALGSIAGRESAEALKEAMRDSNVHVRTAATLALPFVIGIEAGPFLRDAAEDKSTWVRRAALRGLGVSGWPEAAMILRSELQHPFDERFWLNAKQELTAALEGAAFLGNPLLADSVISILRNNPGVGKAVIWKTLLTLGGKECISEMLLCLKSGEYSDMLRNLDAFDPSSFASGSLEELESAFRIIPFKRVSDRIAVLRFLRRIPGEASPETSLWLLDLIEVTDDPDEFEVLMETMKSRDVTPRGYDLARIVDRTARKKLQLTRKGIVSMLRWASTGKYTLSKAYLEKLLRHDSREIRDAAARTVISLARKQSDREEKSMPPVSEVP
jgi:GGDEF domain-containing protein/HEAT repeat protein